MNAQDTERFEAILRRYNLQGLAYNSAYVVSFADTRLDILFDQGIESGEEVDDLEFLYNNAERYAGVLEDREADAAYERQLLRAVNRRRIDPFYTIV